MPALIPMTSRQRAALLALPDSEDAVVRHHSFDANDLAAIAEARTPETRLSYALQLACLRFPGRLLRRGEPLPAVMLDHVAEQIGVDADVISGFARRTQTRYEQLASIKRRFGFADLSRPARADLAAWLRAEAVGLSDGKVLIERLLARMRARRIIIPGITVIERLAGEAMHAAEVQVTTDILGRIGAQQRAGLEALLTQKVHAQQTRLSWLREPPARVGGRSLLDILDKIDRVRATGYAEIELPPAYRPRLALMAREGARFTAQALQQMRPARRLATLLATMRELEATLTDAAITMFSALVGRANLNARKRLEETIATADEQGRARLARIADVLEALASAARRGADIGNAVAAVADLDIIEADAVLIRRTIRPGRPDVLGELAAEYRVFKQVGHRFLRALSFEGRTATSALRSAIGVLVELGSDWRTPLPVDVPLGHIERRWHRHVVHGGKIDRTYWELATYFAVSSALTAGDLWVPTSRVHRALEELIAPPASPTVETPLIAQSSSRPTADDWLARKAVELDQAVNRRRRRDPRPVHRKCRFYKEKAGHGGGPDRRRSGPPVARYCVGD